MRVLYPVRSAICSVGFLEKKNGEFGEKPTEQGENQQQTQPAYDTGPESNPRGERSHQCAITAIPAPQVSFGK